MNAKSFIFGCAFGSCVTGVAAYFIAKKKIKETDATANQRCEQIVLQMREYYEEKYTVTKSEIMKDKDDPSEIVKKYKTEEKSYPYAEAKKEDMQEYSKLTNRYLSGKNDETVDPAETERPTEDEPDAPDEYYEEKDIQPSDEEQEADAVARGMLADVYSKMTHGNPPEIISADEFGQAPGFDTQECVYYVPDLTYCDEGEEIIDDEIRTFGPSIKEWAENNEMTDDIYIRNYDFSCDYRIEKMFCNCPQYIDTHM